MTEPPLGPEGERWRIRALLGRGSFGEVYEVEYTSQDGFRRLVAVKTLRADLDDREEHGRRLRDEARVLGLIRHPAVVTVERTVRLNGRWGFVMERVDGVNIGEILALEPLPVAPALHIVAEIAGALDACVRAEDPDGRPLGLLHRDIKPGNVLVTARGEVKVLDFGIARAAFVGREAETRAMIFGSPGYMAPERFEGLDGPAADLYSLGVVAYEMLSGQRLGRASTDRARHTRRVDASLAWLAAERPELPTAALALVRQLLDGDGARRGDAASVRATALAGMRGLHAEPFTIWAERIVPAVRDEQTTLIPGPWSAASAQTPPPAETPPAPAPPDAPVTPRGGGRPARKRALLLLALVGLVGGWVLSRARPERASAPTRPATGAPPIPSPPAERPLVSPVAAESSPPRSSSTPRRPAPLAPTEAPAPSAPEAASPSPRRPVAPPPELCASPGAVRVTVARATGPLRWRVDGGEWADLPDCVAFPGLVADRPRPYLQIGLALDAGVQPIDELTLGATTQRIVLDCDDRGCSRNYDE